LVELLEGRTLLATSLSTILPAIASTDPSSSVLVTSLPTIPASTLLQAAPQLLGTMMNGAQSLSDSESGQPVISTATAYKSEVVPVTTPSGETTTQTVLTPLFSVIYAPTDNLANPSSGRTLVSSPGPALGGSNSASDSAASSSSGVRGEMESELTPAGIGTLTLVPAESDVTLRGLLQADHTWMTYRMPVDARTHSVNLSVNSPETTPSSIRPAVDELYLVDQSGLVLAQLKGAAANWVGPRQDLAISLNSVPDGAQLLFRVVETPVPSDQASAPDPAPQGGTVGPVPFVMDVKRTEADGPTPPSEAVLSTPSVSNSSAGSLSVNPVANNSATGARLVVLPRPTRSDETPVETAANVAPAAAADTPAADLVADLAPPAAVGPMIVVGSAPLGPPLGTSRGDATVLMDRNERAFDLALEGSSAGIDPELIPSVMAGHRSSARNPTGGAGAGDSCDPSSPDALQGPGGFPLLGSAPDRAIDQLDPEAVLATLSPQEPMATGREGIDELAPVRPSDVADEPGPKSHRLRSADFLTAACGVVLGVSLTSGPLYPDLATLIRRAKSRFNLVTGAAAGSPDVRRSGWRRLLGRLGSRFRRRSPRTSL
jgi:hypothetical protein